MSVRSLGCDTMRSIMHDPTSIGTLIGLALALVLALVLSGCSGTDAEAATGNEDPDGNLSTRFEIEYVNEDRIGGKLTLKNLYVLTDRATGVQYVARGDSGWTPLLDEDGRPMSNMTEGDGGAGTD